MPSKTKSESDRGFDDVTENRRWKEAVAAETQDMTASERMAYFRSHSSVTAIAARAQHPQDASCIVREDPPAP